VKRDRSSTSLHVFVTFCPVIASIESVDAGHNELEMFEFLVDEISMVQTYLTMRRGFGALETSPCANVTRKNCSVATERVLP